MARKFKEIRLMDVDAMREFCIKRDLFTRGTNDEYDEFLRSVANCENITTDDLVRFAEEIIKHSKGGWDIEELMSGIAYQCYTNFVEEK